MSTKTKNIKTDEEEFDAWYKYGVFILYLEMFIAIAVTIFSLYMAFTGTAGFLTH